MKITLFEDTKITDLFPIAMTRHVAEIRWGASTILEKWSMYFDDVALHTNRAYLNLTSPCEGLCILGNILPNDDLVQQLKKLIAGQYLTKDGKVLAYHTTVGQQNEEVKYGGDVICLERLSDLFSQLGKILDFDFVSFNNVHFSNKIPDGVVVIGDHSNLKLADDAIIQPGSIINCSEGPVILDSKSEIMEGCMVRGPFYLGRKSALKMGAKVYGPTAIGPECKVVGEVSNVMILGYSNKAHDGFLGNAVVGEWCNFGADSNCSNLKNNYGVVKQYSYTSGKEENTGLTFCGVVMGDHSKCGINTMFNTGTVVGIAANIFGADFPAKHIPSFSWGGSGEIEVYQFDKAIETIKAVKKRRGLELSDREWHVLSELNKQFGFKK